MKNIKRVEVVLAALSVCGSLALAGGNAPYPKERLAAFLVEKLDVNSLPAPLRPKKAKGKKTLADYGYTAQKLEEKEAVVTAPDGARALSFRILEASEAGLYVCVSQSAPNGNDSNVQSLVLVKRKDWNALLKGQESRREFEACPVIGGSDSPAGAYGGD